MVRRCCRSQPPSSKSHRLASSKPLPTCRAPSPFCRLSWRPKRPYIKRRDSHGSIRAPKMIGPSWRTFLIGRALQITLGCKSLSINNLRGLQKAPLSDTKRRRNTGFPNKSLTFRLAEFITYRNSRRAKCPSALSPPTRVRVLDRAPRYNPRTPPREPGCWIPSWPL